jgi:putative oxidoreductase
MNNFFYYLTEPAAADTIQKTLCFMRVGIGILTIGHGIPKIMGGIETWRSLGSFVNPLGIYFLPVMWGFLGACTEFFGGIALTFGLATRLASACLIVMMFVAVVWHLRRGDSYDIYSFPLSLIVIYAAFLIIGSGTFSLDYQLSGK